MLFCRIYIAMNVNALLFQYILAFFSPFFSHLHFTSAGFSRVKWYTGKSFPFILALNENLYYTTYLHACSVDTLDTQRSHAPTRSWTGPSCCTTLQLHRGSHKRGHPGRARSVSYPRFPVGPVVVPHNRVGFFTFFHSPRRRILRRPRLPRPDFLRASFAHSRSCRYVSLLLLASAYSFFLPF